MIDEIRTFYDGYIDKLSKVNNRHRWVFRSLDKFIPKNIRVLDIGCGAGLTSRHLAEGGRRVVAIDLSPKLIEYAQKHNNHEKILYQTCDITNKLELSDKFDAIVMVDVLEHILTNSLNMLFANLSELSYDNTRIYLNIPCCEVINFLKVIRPGLLQIVDNPISTGEILRMFSSIGFIPFYYQLYWGQYVEYLFLTKTYIFKLYSEVFNENDQAGINQHERCY